MNKAVSLGASRGFEFTHQEVEAAIANPITFLEESIGKELSDLKFQILSSATPKNSNSS